LENPEIQDNQENQGSLNSLPDAEPEISPDDTQPRKLVAVPTADSTPEANESIETNDIPAEPAESGVVVSKYEFDPEPEIAPEDTQPRPAIIPAFERIGGTEEEEEEQPQPAKGPGCNPLLVGTVLLAFLCLFAATVGLAGYAGWRDGSQMVQTKKAVAVVATSAHQATLAGQDCREGRFELCYERCQYVATLQPYYPGVEACMAMARFALSATPTPTVAPTIIAPTSTPPATLQPGQPTREELYIRAKEALRRNDFEAAMGFYEALRGVDADYQRTAVEDDLVNLYKALAGRYRTDGRLSEMIIVVNKMLKIRDDAEWSYEVNIAELYLSAKGYVDAGNFKLADQVFGRLMEIAPTYRDTKELACQAFRANSNGEAIQKWAC
jgi:tetratricopeptide (TPR) repeat protein